jgi:hypothetical protein
VGRCRTYAAAGGWGPPTPGAEVKIPSRNVIVANNLVYNPSGYQSQWQHFQVDGPASSLSPNLPATVHADVNLIIRCAASDDVAPSWHLPISASRQWLHLASRDRCGVPGLPPSAHTLLLLPLPPLVQGQSQP